MAKRGQPLLESARRVFADTSYFFALLDPRDASHARAVEISEEVLLRNIELVTTWEIVLESATLLRYRRCASAFPTFC